jgi:alpha-glucosidase
VDFHGIFKPVGLNRTYPNVLNFEGVFGLENMKWCNPERCDMPRNDVILPFVRQAAGQMDYTPGALRNAVRKDFRAVNSKPMSQGTRAHQLACYVVFDAPLQMLCDSPSDYLKEDETTKWISSIPTTFDSTRILAGETGEYIVTLREKDGRYYVGGMTSWNARDIRLDFNFLPEGEWRCRSFRDGVNADKVGEDYVVGEYFLTAGHKESVYLAPGGGFVLMIEKK